MPWPIGIPEPFYGLATVADIETYGDNVFKQAAMCILAAVLFFVAPADAETARPAPSEQKGVLPPLARGIMGIVEPLVFYIPNRVFDLLDILRLRVRAGPGLSAGARATELVDVFAGSHATVYAGLRGSRGKKGGIPWPFGIENHGGVEVSVIDITNHGPFAPVVDPLELGFEAQAGIVGMYFALEPYEMLDFVTGFIFLDIRGDDF